MVIRLESVSAIDTRTGAEVRVLGNYFADCTGHAWVGAWADADREMTPDGHMGMSNVWGNSGRAGSSGGVPGDTLGTAVGDGRFSLSTRPP